MEGSERISSNISTSDLPAEADAPSKVFYLGFVLYLVSFFLPSIWDLDRFLPGWSCACITLFVWMESGLVDAGYQLGVRLTIFGALMNLLAVAYIILTMPSRRGPRARLVIAVSILIAMPPMWLSLYFLGASPYVGHGAWIIGLLAMIWGDIQILGKKRLLRIAGVISSFVLALLSHGFSISRDPLAQGPSFWGLTPERNRFSGEPLFLDLFRELLPKTYANPVSICLSLFLDSVMWFVVLVAAARVVQKKRQKNLDQANA